MKNTKKKTGFMGKILILLSVVLAIFAGGYFFLDKLIVPKYFKQYGISNVPDLVGVVTSLYKNPKESKLVKNGYTQNDISSAIKILQDANYKISDDGTILKDSEFKGNKQVSLTDREFAGICNKLIENGILVDALPNLNYLNVINISILEVNITPDDESYIDGGYSSANISFIAKIDTADIREQIATQMNTPIFLLNMIIPEKLYFSVSYDLDLTKEDNERISNGTIAINGRTEKQSETLINLLIEFIFPEEEKMDIKKFTETLGNLTLEGIDALGDVKFAKNLGTSKNRPGIVVNPAI